MLAGATWYFVSANLRQHDAIANKNVTGLDYEDREERVGFRSYFVKYVTELVFSRAAH